MEIRLTGTGGRGGWPQPHCRCASCERARSAGRRRAPAQVLVDGVLRVDSARTPVCGPAARHRRAETRGRGVTADGARDRVKRRPGGRETTGTDGAGPRVRHGPGGGAGRADGGRGRARGGGVRVGGGDWRGRCRQAGVGLAAEPRVTYRAAGAGPEGAQRAAESDWRERVAAHGARGRPWWQTVESVDAAG